MHLKMPDVKHGAAIVTGTNCKQFQRMHLAEACLPNEMSSLLVTSTRNVCFKWVHKQIDSMVPDTLVWEMDVI